MIQPFYINSAICISAQDTLSEEIFSNFKTLGIEPFVKAIDPNYKDFIPASQIRRMSKAVKMSMVAAHLALKEAVVENPDAIIVGTGVGCMIDSEKFLTNVIQNNEDFLTPTHFIQSTHNTVAGQIALGLQCHGYNFTYVNPSSALAFSLLDAGMHVAENAAKQILVGVADETAPRTIALYQLNHTIIANEELPTEILKEKKKGVIWSEGASFFVAEATKKENSLVKVIGIEICNEISIVETQEFIQHFLKAHDIQLEEIDTVVLGYNGSQDFDRYYEQAALQFPNANQLYWKHLSGEFNTSAGFAVFMACQILKNQNIPSIMKVEESANTIAPKTILIYNQYKGKDHSLILLQQP